MTTNLALPNGKLVVTFQGTIHAITRIEYDSNTLILGEFESTPDNADLKDFVQRHVANNKTLVLPSFVNEAREFQK